MPSKRLPIARAGARRPGPGDARRAPERKAARAPRPSDGHVLITGGAGFIGCNLADRLLGDGERVVVYDNLSRAGVERNALWLRERHGERVRVSVADVRDRPALRQALRGARMVYHFAAQVAVTTSLDDPIADFEVNAGGTLGLLEEIRRLPDPPPVLLTSTNKVYGALPDIALKRLASSCHPEDPVLRSCGVGEDRPLDLHSPYGCSKGAADQYVLDYARTFGIRSTVFRMSCIYGPRQFGTEDQGWIAHFLIRALEGRPITIYGDGLQVRDALFVEDLVRAFLRARAEIAGISGRAFNIGGGPQNAVSLVEVLDLVRELTGRKPEIRFADWRPGDQRWYVSNTAAFGQATGWKPTTRVRAGMEALTAWLKRRGQGGRGARLPEKLDIA